MIVDDIKDVWKKKQIEICIYQIIQKYFKTIKKFTFAIATYMITKFVQNDFGKTVSALI